MGGQICDASRDEWDIFGRGDDFAQTCREADDANNLAVSSLQCVGQESNANNDKAKKLEPGTGILLTINLRDNIENNLLCRECVDDCDCLGGHQHVCKAVTRDSDPTNGRNGKMYRKEKLSLYENNVNIVLAALTMGVEAQEIKNLLTLFDLPYGKDFKG
eukprot:5025848-Ditylum_brightwellii.AAC.1